MPELARPDFDRALPLVPAGCGMARAVLEGRAHGRAWVDDRVRPARALVGTVQLWYLLGPPGERAFERELREVFERVVLPGGAVMEGDEQLVLTHDRPGWGARLAGLLGGRDLVSDPRRYLELAPRDLRPAQIPEGYSARAVDADFLEAALDEPASSIRHWIDGHHRERTDFFERCAATVLTRDGAPVSWCVTDCRGEDGAAEVGVETAPEHRRRGLAAAVVARTCALLLERGVARIGWQCHARNAGSLRTAARVGFRPVRDYPGHLRMFDPQRHDLVRDRYLLELEQDPGSETSSG